MAFYEKLSALSFEWEQVQTVIANVHKRNGELVTQVTELSSLLENLQKYNKQLEKDLHTSKTKIELLEKQVSNFADEQREFTKVSRIISIENENTRLREDIVLLERRIAIYQNQLKQYLQPQHSQWKQNSETAHNTDIADVASTDNGTDLKEPTESPVDVTVCEEQVPCVIAQEENGVEHTNTDTKSEDDDTHDTDAVNVVEKKIKGVVYYLSDDGDIHKKNDDESIGEVLGKLEKTPAGKSKVVWNK